MHPLSRNDKQCVQTSKSISALNDYKRKLSEEDLLAGDCGCVPSHSATGRLCYYNLRTFFPIPESSGPKPKREMCVWLSGMSSDAYCGKTDEVVDKEIAVTIQD